MTVVWKNNTMKTCCVVISVCAFLFQLASVATPGWTVLYIETNADDTVADGLFGGANGGIKTTASCGLWYVVACVEMDQVEELETVGSICKSVSYFDALTYAQKSMHENVIGPSQISSMASFVEFEVESSISVLACMIGVILVCLSTKQYTRSRTYAGMASICLLVSGLVFWIPIGKFISLNNTLSEPNGIAQLVQSAGVKFEVSFPYSVALAAVGACLALVESLIIMCYLWKNPVIARGQVIHNGAPLESLPPSVYPYGQSGYTVMVMPGAAPTVSSYPPVSGMPYEPMVGTPQPMPSEFGAKYSLLQNQEVNC